MKMWKSCAEWDKSIPGFNTRSVTEDEHDTKEQAEAVCKLLSREGLGGDGRFYPIRTWVEEINPNTGRHLRPEQNTHE